MQKKLFVSFASLFTFWIIISGVTDLQHIVVGIIISLFTVWFWKDLEIRLPTLLSPIELLLFGRCILMLIGYVIKSNINVAKILLFSDVSEGSIFLELEPGIKSDWGRVFLATCITITPGTITIDFDPENDIFTVHALTRETGISLYYWRIITEIKNLEIQIRRRKAHVMDNDRIHGSNSAGTSQGNHRTNGD